MSWSLHTCFCCCTYMLGIVVIGKCGSQWFGVAYLCHGLVNTNMVKGLRSVERSTNDEHIGKHDNFTS